MSLYQLCTLKYFINLFIDLSQRIELIQNSAFTWNFAVDNSDICYWWTFEPSPVGNVVEFSRRQKQQIQNKIFVQTFAFDYRVLFCIGGLMKLSLRAMLWTFLNNKTKFRFIKYWYTSLLICIVNFILSRDGTFEL